MTRHYPTYEPESLPDAIETVKLGLEWDGTPRDRQRFARMVKHYERREAELLETTNRYLERARSAEYALADLRLNYDLLIEGAASS